MEEVKRVFLYARVSTQEQAKEGYSITEQIERLKLYCKIHNWIVVKSFVDAGYSGSNTNRPDLQNMLQDIKKRLCDCVLVYKLDRLSRSQKDTLELIEDYFLKNNVDFISITENFDTTTAFGKAVIGVLSVFAQLEREQIKERMALGREARAKEGKYYGAVVPIGYDYSNQELKINEEEAKQIRFIYELYNQGHGIPYIERALNKNNFKNKYSAYSQRTINYILRNNLYCGYVSFEKKSYKGLHEPIISEELFNTTQNLIEKRCQGSIYRNTGNKSLLSGFIYCEQCGARYSYASVINGRKRSYYSCYSRRKINLKMVKNPNCKNKIYQAKTLENIVLNEIKKLALDSKYIHKINQIKTDETFNNQKNSISKEIAKIDKQRAKLLELYTSDFFSIEELTEKIKNLNEYKNKLENDLKKLDDKEISKEKIIKILSTFNEVIDNTSIEEKRLFLSALIDKILINDESIKIKWKF